MCFNIVGFGCVSLGGASHPLPVQSVCTVRNHTMKNASYLCCVFSGVQERSRGLNTLLKVPGRTIYIIDEGGEQMFGGCKELLRLNVKYVRALFKLG